MLNSASLRLVGVLSPPVFARHNVLRNVLIVKYPFVRNFADDAGSKSNDVAYAFLPLGYDAKQKAIRNQTQSNDPEFFEALKEERKSLELNITRPKWKDIGKGETPSSILRHKDSEFRRETLIEKKNITIPSSKLNNIAKSIRQLTVDEALDQLRFSPRPISATLMNALHNGVKKAELEHGLKQNELYVAIAQVGTGKYFKRVRPHARGKAGRRLVKHSHLFMVLRELSGESVHKYKLFRRKLLKERNLGKPGSVKLGKKFKVDLDRILPKDELARLSGGQHLNPRRSRPLPISTRKISALNE